METTRRARLFGVTWIVTTFVLAAVALPASGAEPAPDTAATGAGQSSPCLALLKAAAGKAGVRGTPTNIDDTDYGDGFYTCHIQYVVSAENGSDATKTSLLLNSSQPTVESSCEYAPQDGWESTTFHGYNAETSYYKSETRMVNDLAFTYERKDLGWCMYKGDRSHSLRVWTDTQSIEAYGEAQDPVLIANVLWSMAEDTLPLSESYSAPSGDVGDVAPGEPDDPSDTAGTGKVPLAIVLASLGIPVAGAIAGSVVSSLIGTGASSAASSIPAAPKIGDIDEHGLVWSARPWDQAGPGFVPREEFEQTQAMLAQGYRWTTNGWQLPEQIGQTSEWEAADRAAVRKEEAAQRAEWQDRQDEIEQDGADEQTRLRMIDLRERLEGIENHLMARTFVANPYQGEPTYIGHRLITGKNELYSWALGKRAGVEGLTCKGYVDRTFDDVQKIAADVFPGSKVDDVLFEENSSLTEHPTWKQWFDSAISDNHNLIKITLSDGTEWAVDFHQARAGNSRVLRPWNAVREEWREYMGSHEFLEIVRNRTVDR